MGISHLKWWILCCVVVAACSLWYRTGSVPKQRHKRSHDGYHPHGYSTNSWWQLMKLTAHDNDETDCYVCAQMPQSTHSTGLIPVDISLDRQNCLYGLSTFSGFNSRSTKNIDRDHRTYPINSKRSGTTITTDATCSPKKDLMPLRQLSVKLPEIISLTGKAPGSLENCVFNNGSKKLGYVPWGLCKKVYTFCSETPFFRPCTKCAVRSNRPNLNCAMWAGLDLSRCDQYVNRRVFNLTKRSSGKHDEAKCSTVMPGPMGSRVLADWYFLCGHYAYTALPPDWGGLCALVPLASPVFALKKDNTSPTHLNRRIKRHFSEVKRWGGLTHETGVPWKFRIWNGGEKFFQSVFPHVGVAEVRDHVEINRYALMRLINDTQKALNGTAGELSAIRQMVLQNRVVLDLLTASQGGVCRIIGTACCTYIPSETEEGGLIHDALEDLDELRRYVNSATHSSEPFDLWSWLMSGAWWQLLLKLFIPVIFVLLLFFLFFCCVIPCLRSVMFRAVTQTLVQMQMTAIVSSDRGETVPFSKR